MTVNAQENQAVDPKQNELEKNFATQRKHFEKQLEQERQLRFQAQLEAEEAKKAAQERERSSRLNDDDDDAEPYVDKKRFQKGLNQFEEKVEKKTQAQINHAVQMAIQKERMTNYLKDNSDFEQVMKPEILEKFVQKQPNIARGILAMPESFERQKLVYETIKGFGIHNPEEKEPSIQEKIDANRRSPFYQPGGGGQPSYKPAGDFSKEGKKQAYDKMQELKGRLRLN